jgi:nicastrin
VAATARYVPAYSTTLRCDGCSGAATFYDNQWKATDEAAEWNQQLQWPPDPMWTESNWPEGQPSLLLYQAENPAVVRATWLLGAASTAGTFAALLAARAFTARSCRQ